MPTPRSEHRHAIGIEEFSRINTSYDEDMPMAQPLPKWRLRAKCRGMHPQKAYETFFPKLSPSTYEHGYDEARRYCKPCPVKKQCLEEAIDQERGDPSGMRGNKTDQERRAIYKDRIADNSLMKRKPRMDVMFKDPRWVPNQSEENE